MEVSAELIGQLVTHALSGAENDDTSAWRFAPQYLNGSADFLIGGKHLHASST